MTEKQFEKSTLRPKSQITLPKKIKDYLGINEGDDLVFWINETGQVVLQKAQTIPPDQAWFWTERWQKMEREAQDDIDHNRITKLDDKDLEG